ncbi:penicillin-binding protein 1C [uncultured Odoribacter sp.]|uniref:penicillin-binding protein 1C n=1 Tax=uncultured Odoribacter sp. TaxID=876416 RepID=UPI0026306CD2|nr:penicillin-binding protein 1C [uncultured Odoribacter sp.]
MRFYRFYILFFILYLFYFIFWWNVLPRPLFDVPYSTLLFDRKGKIIGVKVARDEQFRFRGTNVLPEKYREALLTFEDKRFWVHKGVDWYALARAMYRNIKSGKVVSGGSTVSMQVIRLARKNPPRTYAEKFWEIFLTLRLEQSYSKEQILQLYATHAPFGRNIVGLQAASLKYFNRDPGQLSWAEAAFLAVLPNAPALNNVRVLREKRNRLLKELYLLGKIEEDDYHLALEEPMPEKVYYPENIAPHLLANADINRQGEICDSYIDAGLQKAVYEIVLRHNRLLGGNHIYNAAVLVAHIPSGEVRAYVGNTPAWGNSRGNEVDMIPSVRSSGSILKPALYALMQQNGYILPKTLVPDIPSRFGGYAPSNFNRTFQGVVPADKALSMSLNIPFVRLLKEYNYSRFYKELKLLGIHSLNRPPDDYGLSLILGGGETSLWDLCNMYGGMVSVLRHYNETDGQYYEGEYSRLKIWKEKTECRKSGTSFLSTPCVADKAPLSAASIWLTLEALREVERPELESGWKNFASHLDLAWKTGTSFGYRDAWAIGVNADWIVGVWVGNSDGEGRPGLVGVRAAAPILFEVAGLLPVQGHLYKPSEEMREAVICRKSGYRASMICEEKDTLEVCEAGSKTNLCPYHRLINLDLTGKWQVNSDCEPVYNIQVKPWFVLTPVQEWYYSRTHSDYRKLPPYRAGCEPLGGDVMEMIYPQKGMRVFIPRDFGGRRGAAVFELAHRNPLAEVYWHIDDHYLGFTRHIHQMEVDLPEGRHVLTIVDNDGNTLRQVFQVVGK